MKSLTLVRILPNNTTLSDTKQKSKMRTKLLSIGLILISITLISCGQTRQEKTIAIINKLNFLESQIMNYNYQLDALKYQVTGTDSVKVLELEKRISEEEIIKRIHTAFNESISDEEINDLYEFMQTSAFEKFFNSGEAYKVIAAQFIDIDNEIESITNNFSKITERSKMEFEPIPVDKEDGFYETTNYSYSMEEKDIELAEKPSLTVKDILEVKKEYDKNNDKQPFMSIVFTKEGAQKFYLLTKKNIGKPIAIVIENHIVSMPIVQSEIIGGKAWISGDFSENDINRMIERLKGNK